MRGVGDECVARRARARDRGRDRSLAPRWTALGAHRSSACAVVHVKTDEHERDPHSITLAYAARGCRSRCHSSRRSSRCSRSSSSEIPEGDAGSTSRSGTASARSCGRRRSGLHPESRSQAARPLLPRARGDVAQRLPDRCVLDGEIVIVARRPARLRRDAHAHPPGGVARGDARGRAGRLVRRVGPARVRRRGSARARPGRAARAARRRAGRRRRRRSTSRPPRATAPSPPTGSRDSKAPGSTV